jgi:hypothetical protein
MKLLTSNSLWARYEREKISSILRDKRDISPTQALNSLNIRTKAWPTEWKPYLVAWTRIKGKVPTSSSWPWEAKDIIIGKIKGDELSVKKVLELLRKDTPPSILLQIPQQVNQSIWLSLKFVCNKKKDIFWRLFHRALPLGYRLRHIGTSETGNCIWCSNELQTLEHFALECPTSKTIWREAYRFLNINEEKNLPTSLEDIFQTSNIECSHATQAITWLHINIIYEIWCQYTSVKWGDNIFVHSTLVSRIRDRISREIRTLKYSLLNNNSKTSKILCKFLKCI